MSPTVQGPETEPVDDSGAHPAGRTDPGLPVSTSTGGVAASSQPSLLDADADSESSKERSRTKALILVLVVGAVAVMAAISAGWFSDSDPTALTIVTSPSRSPSSLPTSGANVITTTTATSVALPGATPTTTPDEILGPEPTDTTVPVEIAERGGHDDDSKHHHDRARSDADPEPCCHLGRRPGMYLPAIVVDRRLGVHVAFPQRHRRRCLRVDCRTRRHDEHRA